MKRMMYNFTCCNSRIAIHINVNLGIWLFW